MAQHYVSPQDGLLGPGLEDEISLLDLWWILVRQWKMIGAITTMSFVGAIAYIFLATPVYEAQAVVRPPPSKLVEALNVPGISEPSRQRQPISQITSSDIFAKFTGNLKSSFLRQQFLVENPQYSFLYQQFADQTPQFVRDNLPKIKKGTQDEAGFVFLSVQGHDAKLIADWLNGFITSVERYTINEFVAGVETNLANRKKELESELQIGQIVASQRRLDRIALLEEQISIARSAMIFERKVSNYATVESQRVGETLVTAQESMYMRGVKELTAEKETLEKRKNDKPFIVGFRDKEESMAQLAVGLQQLQAARAIVHAVTVDQPAIKAINPIKPRRLLVLALGIVMGGLMGAFAALAINLIQKPNAKSQSEAQKDT